MVRISFFVWLVFSGLICWISCNQVLAELPAARLFTIAPVGGKIGTSVDVIVTGNDLDGPTGMLFSHPGISAEVKSTNKFSVKIATNVPAGLYDAWVVGKYGSSNPRTFAVGMLNELSKTNGNESSKTARMIPLGVTVNGNTDANAIDYFKFSARQGDCVVVECEAAQLDSKLEPVFTLFDETGRELVRSRSGAGLHYYVPGDATLQIGLHDVLYRGGAEFFYRLSVGTFPRIHSLLPTGNKSSPETTFSVIGLNFLDGKKSGDGLQRLELGLSPANFLVRRAIPRIPASAALDVFEYRARNGSGISEPVEFTFPVAPVFVANPMDQRPAEAQPVLTPCEIAGEFNPNRKSTWFSFAAKKGASYWIELISQRLGYASDPLVVLQHLARDGKATDVLELNDSDENVGGIEFNTKSRDPRGRFEAKEDGIFRIEIKDLFTHNQEDPPTPYRLRIRQPLPDFDLVAMPASPALARKDSKEVLVTTTLLRRNGTVPIKVVALRRDGFDGQIMLSVDGLPKGVTAVPAKIEKGKSAAVILLHANDPLEAASVAVKIHGSSEMDGSRISRDAHAATLIWTVADSANEPIRSRECEEFRTSTISETEPIRLFAAPEKIWEGVSTGKVNISLTIERPAEFKMEAFTVTPIGAPGLENIKEFEIGATATNTVYTIDLAQQKLAPGDYRFSLHGFAKGKRTKPPGADPEFTVYSAPIALRVNAPAK